MSTVLKNTQLSGLAVLMIFGAFVFLQVQNRQIAVAEAQKLPLSALLENPMKYASLNVSVRGVLLWHPDEPTLFADESSSEKLDFRNSIQLFTAPNVDFQFASEKPVVASGVFFFDPEITHRLRGYRGVFRVKSIVVDRDSQH